MSFPDDSAFLAVPKDFAAFTRAGQVGDLRVEASALRAFARNFFLQWFQEECGVEVTGFNPPSHRRAKAVERTLKGDDPGRFLVSHYLTMAEVLDEQAETSAELEPDEIQEETFLAIEELLSRIAGWAQRRNLNDVAKEAAETYEQFGRAVATLV